MYHIYYMYLLLPIMINTFLLVGGKENKFYEPEEFPPLTYVDRSKKVYRRESAIEQVKNYQCLAKLWLLLHPLWTHLTHTITKVMPVAMITIHHGYCGCYNPVT